MTPIISAYRSFVLGLGFFFDCWLGFGGCVWGVVFVFLFYFLQLTESNFGCNSKSSGSLMQTSYCICFAAVYTVHRHM